jgi:hypothetical protein
LIEASDTAPELRAQAEADLRELVPVLVEVGVFDVFQVRSPRIRALIGDVEST